MKFRITLVVIVALIFLIIAGCVTQSNETPIETAAVTVTQQATTKPTQTSTPLPTDTPVPPPTPTPTATLSYPVRSGTAIPELDLPIIGLENAENLVEMARWGSPKNLGYAQLYPGSDKCILVDMDGVRLVDNVTGKVKDIVNTSLSLNSTAINMYGVNPGAAASADGKFFAVLSENGQVQVWNDQNKKMFEIDVPSTQLSKYDPRYFIPAFSVSMSVDGKYLAMTDPDCDVDSSPVNCKILVIDWEKNETVASLSGQSAFFSPGGKYLIVFQSIPPNNKFEFFYVDTWESVFYEIFSSAKYNFLSIAFSPVDTFFTFTNKSGVTVYRTENFLTNLTITNFRTYYAPDIIFSPDEKEIHIISSYMGEPPEWYTFNIANGALISEQTYEELGQVNWAKKRQELVYCKYTPRTVEGDSLFGAHFNDTLLQENGVLEVYDENGSRVRFGDYPDIPGFVSGVWNDKLIISLKDDNDDPYNWWTKIIGFLDLTTKEYIQFDHPDIQDDYSQNLSYVGGTKWLVFNVMERTRDGNNSKVLAYDSVTGGIISERERLNTGGMVFYPLEKWNAIGYLDNNICTNFFNLGEDQQGPVETCLEMEKGRSPLDSEFIISITTGFDGKLVMIGTTHGNLYLLDNDTGEYRKVNLTDSEITDIAIAPDGKMISTYSAYGDGYTRVWAVMDISDQ